MSKEELSASTKGKKGNGLPMKYPLPMILCMRSLCLGILYLFVMGIVENDSEVAHGTLLYESFDLEREVSTYVTFFWGLFFAFYSIRSVFKGIKQQVKFSFKELKTYLKEVVVGFMASWYITLLLFTSSFSHYNQSDAEVVKSESINITEITDKVVHSGGSRGSTSKRVYDITTDSQGKFKKIKTSSDFYGSLSEGVPLLVDSFKGRLGYGFYEVSIPEEYINKELINWRGKSLENMLEGESLTLIVLFFLTISVVWMFFLMFQTPHPHKRNKIVKVFVILGLIPLPFLLYFYCFSYDTFTSTVILAVLWMSFTLSILPGYLVLRILRPFLIRFYEAKGAAAYFIVMSIILVALLAGLSYVQYSIMMELRQV